MERVVGSQGKTVQLKIDCKFLYLIVSTTECKEAVNKLNHTIQTRYYFEPYSYGSIFLAFSWAFLPPFSLSLSLVYLSHPLPYVIPRFPNTM
jgi:hypothetical protein